MAPVPTMVIAGIQTLENPLYRVQPLNGPQPLSHFASPHGRWEDVRIEISFVLYVFLLQGDHLIRVKDFLEDFNCV